MMNPKVSIFIISKNRPKLLRRAIDSCLNQTYKNIEIVVVDDCSESFDVFLLESDLDSPVCKFFKMKEPSGANACRNKAVEMASGIYITGLDDDDYFTPERVEKMLFALENKSPTISAVSSRFMFETLYRKKTPTMFIKKIVKNVTTLFSEGNLITVEDSLNKNMIGNQILISKNDLISIGGFDERMPALQDYETWLRVLTNLGPIYRLNKFLYIKDDSLDDSITKSNKKKLLGFDYILNKHPNVFEGRVHCLALHKLLYEHKKLSFGCAISLFKPGNRFYIIKLALSGRIKFVF